MVQRLPQSPAGSALNAIAPPTDQAQRRARHLRQCERLAELGMDLAEAAHREALRELQPPAMRRPSPLPDCATVPGLPTPPTGRDATFGQLFAQLSRSVRQAILLEARIAAGAYDHPPAASNAGHTRPANAHPTPHSAPSLRPTHPAADRPEHVEDDLAADLHRSVPDILSGIRRDLAAARHTAHATAPAPEPDAQRVAARASQSPAIQPRPPPLSALERAAELAERPRSRPPPA